MKKYRSAELMQLSYKGYFKAMGYSEDELSDKKPRIGIANSWNQLVPGHLRRRRHGLRVRRDGLLRRHRPGPCGHELHPALP